MDLEDLKNEIRAKEPEDFVQENILAGACLHFSAEGLEVVRQSIQTATGVGIETQELSVVGSARLGFALHPINPAIKSMLSFVNEEARRAQALE